MASFLCSVLSGVSGMTTSLWWLRLANVSTPTVDRYYCVCQWVMTSDFFWLWLWLLCELVIQNILKWSIIMLLSTVATLASVQQKLHRLTLKSGILCWVILVLRYEFFLMKDLTSVLLQMFACMHVCFPSRCLVRWASLRSGILNSHQPMRCQSLTTPP